MAERSYPHYPQGYPQLNMGKPPANRAFTGGYVDFQQFSRELVEKVISLQNTGKARLKTVLEPQTHVPACRNHPAWAGGFPRTEGPFPTAPNPGSDTGLPWLLPGNRR